LVCGRCGRKRLGNPLNLFADLEDFLHDHRAHGRLTADATEPAWNGYLLTVPCLCGMVFGRWVTVPHQLQALGIVFHDQDQLIRHSAPAA
jgi:hypothetical protein